MEKQLSSFYLSRSVIETTKTYFISALLASGILLLVSLFVNYILLCYVGAILFLMPILASLVVEWTPKERISPDGKAVFITGCDRGFGYMLAQRLDDLGFHVFAGCFFPEGNGASALRKSGSNRLHVVGLDVTSDTSVLEAVAYVKENLQDNVLWAVVNNAGIPGAGEIPWISMETIQKVIEVNTLGVARVTKAFLSKLKESKGRIITIASLGGRYAVPGLVPYSMSKAAAISFCDGLRLEMYKWDIQVITIEPSFYRTAMISEEEVAKRTLETWEKAPKDVKDMYGSNYLGNSLNKQFGILKYLANDPSEVVAVMEDAIMTLYPEYYYSPGNLIFKIASWFAQRLPKTVVDMVIYIIISRGDLR